MVIMHFPSTTNRQEYPLSVPELNALGIEYMIKGDFAQARSLLIRAVRGISQNLGNLEAALQEEQEQTTQEQLHQENQWMVSSPYETKLDPNQDMYALPFVFVPQGRELLHHPSSTLPLVTQERDSAACAACCLFNLALCYHQDWLTQDATASLNASSLNKATGLYEKAYAVVTRFSVIRQGNDTLLKTLLAICVNLAHCYDFGHGNIVMAHRWRTPLRELVDMAVQGGLFTCTSTGHDAQVVYRFFFLSHALLANYARPCANAA